MVSPCSVRGNSLTLISPDRVSSKSISYWDTSFIYRNQKKLSIGATTVRPELKREELTVWVARLITGSRTGGHVYQAVAVYTITVNSCWLIV
jgi:hypothetical protein